MAQTRGLRNALSKYPQGNNAGGRFFKLENDRDTARVRFLVETLDDLDVVTYHEVQLPGDARRRRVSCVEDDCPLCRVGRKGPDTPIGTKKVSVLFFVLDMRDGGVKIWEKSAWTVEREFQEPLRRIEPICERLVEVVRIGVKGDIHTRYSLFPLDRDGTKLEDLPPRLPLMGADGIIEELTRADMEALIEEVRLPRMPAGPALVGARGNSRGEDIF